MGTTTSKETKEETIIAQSGQNTADLTQTHTITHLDIFGLSFAAFFIILIAVWSLYCLVSYFKRSTSKLIRTELARSRNNILESDV